MPKRNDVYDAGKKIYQRLLRKIEPKHRGEIIAIEPETGEYFIGTDELEVLKEARKKHPRKVFYLARIGFPAVHWHGGVKRCKAMWTNTSNPNYN
jgi:hypothetical protein